MVDKEIKKLPIIKTREQLNMVLKGLDDQGFLSYASDWKAHDRKIETIIRKNNTLGIDEKKFKRELTEKVEKLTNYGEIEKIVW